MDDWPQGYGREIHDELDSTNSEALRRAGRAEGPLWILARMQGAGRGRRGRAWSTQRGNFAATLLMTPTGGHAGAGLRTFVAALALREALVELTGLPGIFSLKWPNDVLLRGRKLAGILLETSGSPMRLAIGFGVNLVKVPCLDDLEENAMSPISLAAGAGVSLAPEMLLDRLAPAFDRWETRLVQEGFAPLRDAWLAGAAGLGSTAVVRLPGQELCGRFETITMCGALVLGTPKGRIEVSAGEVFFAGDNEPAEPPAPPGPDHPPNEPPVPSQPDVPGIPDEPGRPDVPPRSPPEEPPVIDPPGPDAPPETPPLQDPPGTDIPTEVPPTPPAELPPGGPAELPQQVTRASGD